MTAAKKMEPTVRERPILFSGAMVRALLAGTKTQTRRIVKPQPEWNADGGGWYPGIAGLSVPYARQPKWARHYAHAAHVAKGFAIDFCPYGAPGDRLWVRESFRPSFSDPKSIHYMASVSEYERAEKGPWKPSIHMPRWASRLTLEITGVRVERLHDITEADAKAEGWTPRPEVSSDPEVHRDAARDWFADLWTEINGAESWQANPWVWVVEFRRGELEAA